MWLFKIPPKLISLFFATLMTLQSCNVYHKAPITFDQAAAVEKKVKLTRTNGATIKFDRILYENGTYFGIDVRRRGVIKVPLDTLDINSIRPKNRTASTIGTIALSIGIAVLVAFGIFVATYDSDWGTIDPEF